MSNKSSRGSILGFVVSTAFIIIIAGLITGKISPSNPISFIANTFDSIGDYLQRTL